MGMDHKLDPYPDPSLGPESCLATWSWSMAAATAYSKNKAAYLMS